jgi:hypothetical protein
VRQVEANRCMFATFFAKMTKKSYKKIDMADLYMQVD